MSIDMPSPWIILVAIGLVLLAYGILAPERMALPVLRDHHPSQVPVTNAGTTDAFASGAIAERPQSSAAVEPAPAAPRVHPASPPKPQHAQQPAAPPAPAPNAEQQTAAQAAPAAQSQTAATADAPQPAAQSGVAQTGAEAPATPTWPSLIDDRAQALDASTRKNMIVALGALSEPWCGPILARAYETEPTVELRAAVIAAIRDGRYDEESATLERALTAQSEQERILAIEAFAAIGRHQDLAAAIEDPSVPVATAAAYQLVRAYGPAHVASLLRERTDGTRLQHIDDLLELFS